MSSDIPGLINLILYASIFTIIPLGIFVFFVVNNRKNYNILIKEKLIVQQNAENQLLKTKVEIQESTLNSISVEIHDHIGQLLSLVKLNIFEAAAKFQDENLRECNTILGQIIGDLRNLNSTFNSGLMLKNGLASALEHELNILNRSGKYKVQITKEADLDFLIGEREIIVFRMIQESIHNIIKHAQAQSITISVKESNQSVVISISDDGVGFNHKMVKTGMGLVNLEERAKLIDARLEIFSFPGAGTNIIIQINK